MKSQEIINKLSQEDLLKISDLLGYSEWLVPTVCGKNKSIRFISGICGELKNWNYDETINYGDMGKVLKIIQIISSKCPEFSNL